MYNDSNAVLRWICKNILKMQYSTCFLSRKVATENARKFASEGMVTLSYVSSNLQFFNKPVAGMWLVIRNRRNYNIRSIFVE